MEESQVQKFKRTVDGHLAITEHIKKQLREGFAVCGADRQYAQNVSLVIQKYKKREEEIEKIRREKAEKYRVEYEYLMSALNQSVEEKHKRNIDSCKEKLERCKLTF